MEGTFSRLRLGLGGGRGPEVARRRPLGRGSRDVPKVPGPVGGAERMAGGRGGLGPMSAAAGRDGWVISGRKGQKVKGVMG